MLSKDQLADALYNLQTREWLIENYQEELSEMIESDLRDTWTSAIIGGINGGIHGAGFSSPFLPPAANKEKG